MTQRQLAEAAQLHRATIERIEAGARRTRRSTLERIAAALVVADASLGSVETVADAMAERAVLARPTGEQIRRASQETKRASLAAQAEQRSDD